MVELNHRERTIQVKIVYYGPAIGGKTTNLQVLHQYAQATRRGQMISVNSAQDRTILFDLLPMRTGGFRGFDLKLQILAVPGQAMYAATRRLVLKGADAVVFVANSAADRWEENIQSFREMTQNLVNHQLDPSSLPLVLQYNKRDLPDVTPVEFMDRTLNARRVDAVPAIAVRGEGVLETFSAILLRAMQDLGQRYQIIEQKKGHTLQQWTHQTIVSVFGTTSLAIEPNPVPAEEVPPASAPPTRPLATPGPGEPPPAERRTVRVALPEDAVKKAGMGPDARANETLVESYAQASNQLSTALDEVREERDLMRRRFEDLQHFLGYAQELMAGQPREPTFRAIVARLAEAVGSSHASFLRPDPDGTLRLAALLGLPADPLLHVPAGARHIKARFVGESEPKIHQSADSLDLGDALESQEPRFSAVTVVPIRSPRGLLGLALLYHVLDASLPRLDTLGHLGLMSRTLASSLELASALDTVRAAERSLQLALSGTASVHGLRELVGFLESLRDEFGGMRRRTDVPPAFLQDFVRLVPGLLGALSTARSLLAFSRGELQKEAVSVEDLLRDLRGSDATLEVAPNLGSITGDPVLLRLALKAVADHARGSNGRAGTPLQVRALAHGGRIRISLSGAGSPAVTGPDLGFARRVVELHGGAFAVEAEGRERSRYAISL
jgi:signal recognition particle receptor subunit beta